MHSTPTSHAPPSLRHRLASRFVVSLVCVAAAGIAHAHPASAAVPGINLAATVSPFNSFNKSANVSCPPGQKLYGVGGGIDAGAGQVIVDDWLQLDSAHGAVRGVESTPLTQSWTAGAAGICADRLPGYSRISRTSPANSKDKFVKVACRNGKELVAGGADILGGKGNVMIEEMVPDHATNRMIVLAHEHTGTPDDWQARVEAVCVDPLPGLERHFVPSTKDSTDTKTVSASCSPGKVLIGVGAQTDSSGGQAGIESIEPNPFLNGVTVKATEIDATDLNWEAVAYVLCADA
jgi:hypothetical protein